MGATYPMPGLFSKFFDADHEPVIEVVRDTVGRHDTFNYACTSKYYEDAWAILVIQIVLTNFNNSLEKYEVKPRKGWIAINLFLILQSTDAKTLLLLMNLGQDLVIMCFLEH